MPDTFHSELRRGSAPPILSRVALVLLLVCSCPGWAASVSRPIHDWAVRAGSAEFDTVQAIAADATGHAYISGFLTQPATFGSVRLTNSGPSDAFIAKLDRQGNFLWATKPAATGSDYSGRIAAGPHGEVYVTGSSASPRLTFGAVTVTNHSGGGTFLARLDSSGQFSWGLRLAKYSSIIFSMFPDAVAVDGEGNSVVAGQFDGRMTLGNQSLTNRGVDVYITKVRSDATVDWVFQGGGSGDDLARDVAVDALGNVYACGFFLSSRATFGATILTNRGASALWVAKWNPSGAVLWARTATGKGADSARAVCLDRDGFVYLGGYLGPSVDFGGIVLTNASGREGFLAKLDPDGRFLWAASARSQFGSGINDLAMDAEGSVVAAGDFGGRVNFGTATLTNASPITDFVALFRPDGDAQWILPTGVATSPRPPIRSRSMERARSFRQVRTICDLLLGPRSSPIKGATSTSLASSPVLSFGFGEPVLRCS